MKIDLHVHANERSACALAGEEQQIEAAILAGLNAIAFTDHHRFMTQDRLDLLNNLYSPFRIFSGIEITVDGEDILVFGVHTHELETTSWNYPSLHSYVRSHGGMMILAHPYRFRDEITIPIEQYPPDLIEYRSVNTPRTAEDKIQVTSRRLGIGLVCNSDAHNTDKLGMFYNVIPVNVQNDQELMDAFLVKQPACFACD